jgi:integrase
MSLSKTFVAGSQRVGKHRDADNLYLDIRKDNPRGGSWVFRYTIDGQARSIGLGARSRDPMEVRAEAQRFRKWLNNLIDPREALTEEARQAAAELARRVTFRQAAEAFLEVRTVGWRNAKHGKQWAATLAAYAYPAIGDTAVSEITTPDIFNLLKPIWAAKPETASRVRGRIEAILDFAKVQGHRSGENPAAWRGNLALMLPTRSKVRPVEHHAALDWRGSPAFMQQLLEQAGMGAAALSFAILTAARSGEVRLATWDEIDLEDKVWTIPAGRMKARRDHRVPLSDSALAILDRVKATRDIGPLTFPGVIKTRRPRGARSAAVPLSDMTLTAVLRRMDRGELTAHGFRSTFRDWAAEATHYPNHVVEQALAHAIGDRVEAAYRRGDLFEKRRALMADWARYLGASPAKRRRGSEPLAAAAE